MDTERLKGILQAVKAGRMTIKGALEQLKVLPYEDIGFAKVDHHRTLRHGMPEVIYAEAKEAREVIAIADLILNRSRRLFITRANEGLYREIEALCRRHGLRAEFFSRSGVIMAGGKARKEGRVLVVCAGTSDIPVAEEASLSASFLGSRVEEVYDVGVAGLHRIAEVQQRMARARVIIVVAGMEGALPSVIGGMTDRPVIAVPTSVGYGTGLGGIAPLLAMLNSCVPGIAVMNIDNGFGAGVLAHKINVLKR
jgi:hypothetical protein